jgi:hypothetical protein
MAIAALAALSSIAVQAITVGFAMINWALVATTFVLSAMSRALAPKAPTLASQLRDRTEVVRTAVAPHRIVYGEVPVSGPLVFAASTGASNEYLHLVIALTGHECEAMTTVWFGDIEVGARDVDGNVTAGQFAGLARIHTHLGSPGQTADNDLVAECGSQGWTNNHRLQGRGYVYVRLKYDATAYPNGIPNIKVLVKGKKVYDPRTSQTVWSRNWALCVRDYLTSAYGLRCGSAEIDDAALTLAANISDEAVALAVGSQARYTCDGVLDLSLRPIDHLRALLSGGAGVQVYTQGVYRLFAGAYLAPVVTLTADHLRGPLTVRPRIARKSLFNAVRGTFVDPNKYWQASDFPPMTNATYEAQDGNEQIFADIELPFTIDSIRAQRLAKIHLEKSRQGISVDFPANLSAVKIAVWDIIRLSISHLGWVDKEFRVTGWKMAADGQGVDLVLQEESAESWNWAAGEATIVDPAPDTNLISPAAVPPPSNLVVASGATHQLTGADGINTCRLFASWAASPDATVQYYEIQHKPSTDSAYLSALQSAATQTAYLAPVQSGTSYHVRVRAVRINGALSAWSGPVLIAASSTASTLSAGLDYTAITGTKPPADATRGAPAGTLVGVTLAQTVESNAATALANAAAAQATANTAVTNAATANNLLADIAADNKLTPVEKQSTRAEWDAAYAERAGIRAQADTFGISAEKTTYDNAFQELGTYLNAGAAYTIGSTPPSWINDASLATTTTIAGATFRSYWSTLYAARQTLLNQIAIEASYRASWANVTGAGKPADNADNTETSLQAGTVIATGGLTLHDASEIVTMGAGGNYSRLHSGDLEIYRNVPSVGVTLYKALSRVESGVASNNTLVTIPGYFATQPRVQVSPATLAVFDKDFAAQDQALICAPGSVTETASGSMIWQFTPTATLSLASGNGQTLINASSGSISADNWTSTTYTTPANCNSITPSLTLASARGDGASLYYRRTVRWRVEYWNGSAWINGAWTTSNLSDSASASVTTSATHNFPSSGAWQFRIRTEAYDTDGSKFGSVQYEYNSSDTGSRSDSTNMFVDAFAGTDSMNIAPAYTPPSGWTLDSVNFSFTYSYLLQLQSPYGSTASVSGGGISHTLTGSASQSGTGLSQSGYIASTNNLTLTAIAPDSAQCWIRGLTVNATYTRKRVIANSTTPANTSLFNNYQYALTAAQVLATGTLNWIALGN